MEITVQLVLRGSKVRLQVNITPKFLEDGSMLADKAQRLLFIKWGEFSRLNNIISDFE